MPFLDKLPPQGQIIAGVLIMILGVSFAWKAFQAMVKGKLKYWEGFLPFTLISLFTLHGPSGKRSLIKETEGLWVHMVMGPIYLITSVLVLCAGADIANLPGTMLLNTVLQGGKAGTAISFDKHYGYKFPILARALPVFKKLFSSEADLKNSDRLYENHGSLNDAMNVK